MAWEQDIGDLLSGFSKGYATASGKRMASRSALMDEMKKELFKEQIKAQYNPKEWKPTTEEQWREGKRYEAGLKTEQEKPQYKVVGGKLLQIPTTGGEPSVAYEDPEKIKAKKSASENVIRSTQDMLDTVKTVRKGKQYFGRAGGLPSIITAGLSEDYGPRKVWENEIQKLMAQRMMDKMVELKAASKTGSTGFGQLTEREGRKIQEASTALSRDLLPEDADRYLAIMEDSLSRIIQAAQQESFSGQEGAPANVPSSPMQRPAVSGGKILTRAIAQQILSEAGGNKDRARQLARQRGYSL